MQWGLKIRLHGYGFWTWGFDGCLVDSNPSCYIHNIGTAVPESSISSDESAQLLRITCPSPRSAKLLTRIAPLTGIEKRHLIALNHHPYSAGERALYHPVDRQPNGPGMGARTKVFEQEAGPLMLQALSGLSRESLNRVATLITVTCTQAASPGLDLPILTHTLIPQSVHRWNLGFMGCSAGLAGVRLVHQGSLMRGDALVAACELCSLHFQYTNALDQMTANLLFADGAAAMLLSSVPSAVKVVDCRSVAVPALADQMVWFADDHGLKLRLSQDLPQSLASHLPDAVDGFLRDNNMSRDSVNYWLAHPGGPQILDSVEQSMGLGADALRLSRGVFRRFGNMSSPTIFFILKDLIESHAEGHVVAMAFGPGLTIEMMLLQITRSG